MIKYNSDQLFDKISGAIEPMSFVRYGDGEAMVLNGFDDMPAFTQVMKRQLGHIPTVEQLSQIQNNLIGAYNSADIIGIPGPKRLATGDGYWYNAFKILIDNMGIENLIHKDLTDVDFHFDWLEKKLFHKLLNGRETVCYISCRPIDEQMKRAFEIKNVYSFIIAPEMKFTTYNGETHYPDQFNRVRRWITKIPVDGNICLVGAGAIGKLYCSMFKERGGIALDIGHVFDLWAGRKTRGEGRGKDVFDNTYEL